MTSKNIIAKVAAVVATGALLVTAFAGSAAHAQTTTTTTSTSMSASQVSAIEAQIASLQSELAAAEGTSATASMSTTFTRDLTVGDSGSDVTALQTWLIAHGYSIPAGATGYFGTETQAAVAAFQAANGITPDAGYFGPITTAKIESLMGTSTTTTTTTTSGCAPGAEYSSTTGQACTTTTGTSTTLSGGEGSLNNFQTIGASTTILGQGQNANVYGFSFTAGGSDLNVDRINYDVVLDPSTSGDSVHPWTVFGTATLTDGSGNTIATVDASNQNNWNEEGTGNGTYGASGDQVYQLSFQNLNEVVKEGSSATYYLQLEAQPVISSANNGAEYDVELEGQGVRATDALGLQEYSPTNTTANTVKVEATTAGTVSLSVGSNNPTTTTIQGNQTTPTNNVVLNTFTLEGQGENLELYSLPVTVTTTGGTQTSPSAMVQSLSLYEGSTLLDTVSPAATSTPGTTAVNFNNLNLQIPEGTTDDFSVEANISPIDGTVVTNGSSVTVSVPNSAVIIGNSGTPASTSEVPNVEDAAGNNATISGAAPGNAISFAANGVSVGTPTTGASVVSNGGQTTAQTGTFTFTFNVSAFGQTIYVASTSEAFGLTIHDSTAGIATTTTGSAITSTATRSPLGNFEISNGQTEQFTVQATRASGSSHFFYATLNSLSYGTSDGDTGSATTTLPSTFTTSAVSVQS